MAEVTVKQLASVVGRSTERLLEQIKDAGLEIDSPDSLISDSDKMKLLAYLTQNLLWILKKFLKSKIQYRKFSLKLDV